MKSWIRITSVVFVLIGGTVIFGYWSLIQFDDALDVALNNSGILSEINTSSVYMFNEAEEVQIQSTSSEAVASSTVSINDDQSTTTLSGSETSSSTITDNNHISTTSSKIYKNSATSTPPNFIVTFPKKGDELYIGCTYQISWLSSTTISSLGAVLVDAGTGAMTGPIASGLAKENKIEPDVQGLDWKVGVVWPGGYYIKVSKINDQEVDYRSKIFLVSKIAEGSSDERRAGLCQELGR